MYVEKMKILKHQKLATNIYQLKLQGNLVKQITNPGQFIQIKIQDKYLRRPISIADYCFETNTLILIYKILGEGTKLLTEYKEGQVLDCLGPLGNGFDIAQAKNSDNLVLCGGGVGIPPLYGLAKNLKEKYPEKKITMIAGARTKADIFYEAEFTKITKTFFVTDDGSHNPPARTVINAIQSLENLGYLFACGPTGMLKALEKTYPEIEKQISLEEHMACGVGLCMGCVYQKDDGSYLRVCKEGPVLIEKRMGEV